MQKKLQNELNKINRNVLLISFIHIYIYIYIYIILKHKKTLNTHACNYFQFKNNILIIVLYETKTICKNKT